MLPREFGHRTAPPYHPGPSHLGPSAAALRSALDESPLPPPLALPWPLLPLLPTDVALGRRDDTAPPAEAGLIRPLPLPTPPASARRRSPGGALIGIQPLFTRSASEIAPTVLSLPPLRLNLVGEDDLVLSSPWLPFLCPAKNAAPTATPAAAPTAIPAAAPTTIPAAPAAAPAAALAVCRVVFRLLSPPIMRDESPRASPAPPPPPPRRADNEDVDAEADADADAEGLDEDLDEEAPPEPPWVTLR